MASKSIITNAPEELKRNLTLGFFLLLFLFLVLSSGTYLAISLAVSDKEYDSAVVNLAGRQRMLIQKYSHEINLALVDSAVSDEQMTMEMEESAAQTAKLFEEMLSVLLNGGTVAMGATAQTWLPPIQNNEIIEHLGNVKTEWDELRRSAVVAMQSDHSLRASQNLVKKIQGQTDRVVAEMNRAVEVIQRQSEAKLSRIGTYMTYAGVLSAMLLVGIVVFVHTRVVVPLSSTMTFLTATNEGLQFEIVERLRAELERKQSEERLRLIIESAGDAIVSVNAEGTIVLVNKRAEKIFGYSREEMIGQTVEMFLPQELQAQHVVDRQEYMKTPRPYGTESGRELYAAHKDGRRIPVEVSLAPMQVHGEVHILATVVDITVHRKAKEALHDANDLLAQSNQELEQFAYVASHDLQEPLRKVSSYAQLLREECGQGISEEGHEYLNVVISGANRMKTLVSDLLSFSRITTRGDSLSPTPANHCVQAALDNLEVAIEECGAQVIVQPLPSVIADQGQLTLLFQNLVGNAIKYRGESTPEIRIAGRDLGNQFEFCVRDNGIGFDSKFNDRVFEIFQRLHNRREYTGTGIGLAICKRIVERFGGKIWVESTPDVGSTFYFTLNKTVPQGGQYARSHRSEPVSAAH